MREKVQSPGSQTQSGSPIAVGELPIAAARNERTGQTGVDSPYQNEDLPAADGHVRTGGADVQSRVVAGSGVGIASRVLIFMIRCYQYAVAPWLPDCCRFTPSCSHYAVEAIQVHGFLRGSGYMLWRLLRCQPFCKGGFDPVPPRKTPAEKASENQSKDEL